MDDDERQGRARQSANVLLSLTKREQKKRRALLVLKTTEWQLNKFLFECNKSEQRMPTKIVETLL